MLLRDTVLVLTTLGDDMPHFLHVAAGRSYTSGRMYAAGIHEVEAAVAVRAQELAARYGWKHIHVSGDKPKMSTQDPNAPSGPLTVEDVKLGTAAAAAAADAAANAPAPTPEPAPEAPAPEAPINPYECPNVDCEKSYPTEAALKRHVTMNHAQNAPASDESASLEDSSADNAESTEAGQTHAE